MPERRQQPPSWPYALRAPLAAAFCGLSESAFLLHVAPHVPSIAPSPGSRAWLRDDLAAWLDGLRGSMATSKVNNPWHT